MAVRLRTALGGIEMTTLPRRGLISAGVVLVILTAVNLWMRPDFELQLSPTSFGVGPAGYKAAFDLASELGVPVMRSYVSPKQQPLNRQIWMVSPSVLGTEPAGGAQAFRFRTFAFRSRG